MCSSGNFRNCRFHGIAQEKTNKSSEKKIKFGVVDQSEFEIKPSGRDTSAAAIKLFDNGILKFSISPKGRWNYTYEKHERIKILNKNGYGYADFEVPTYRNPNLEELISSVSVASYNLENGKIIQNKVAKGEKFVDKFDKNWTNNKYTLSNIKEGTIVEIKYTIKSDFIYNLRDWFFQSEIPILKSDFTFIMPEYFRYKIIPQSYVPIKLIEDGSISESISASVQGENATSSNDQVNATFTAYKKRWVAENVPAFKNEAFITTKNDFLARIEFELERTLFPNDIIREYSTSWSKIVSDYLKSESFGEMIIPNGYAKSLAASIVKPDDAAYLKMIKLYSYMQKNIKWNEVNTDVCRNKQLKTTIEAKSGSSGDINLGLLSLLRSVNIKAEPVLLSTRSNGTHPGYPIQGKFNYVVVQATIDNQTYLLDAVSKYLPVGYLSTNALNHKGFLIDSYNISGDWIFLDPKTTSKSIKTAMFNITNDNQLVGDIFAIYTDYDALQAREEFLNATNKDTYLQAYKANKAGLIIKEYANTNIDSLDKNFTESFNVVLEDQLEEAGDLVYFNPMLFDRTMENPFKLEERNFPVDFSNPHEENYKIILNLPSNFKVDKLPGQIVYKLSDNSAIFSYTVTQADSQLLINSKIIFGRSTYNPDQYFEIKELFKKIVEKQAEPIVLKKI